MCDWTYQIVQTEKWEFWLKVHQPIIIFFFLKSMTEWNEHKDENEQLFKFAGVVASTIVATVSTKTMQWTWLKFNIIPVRLECYVTHT